MVVTANLNSKTVNVNLAVAQRPLNNNDFPHERFRSMIDQSLPTAAIDGTYYDTRTFRPVGSLVTDGKMVVSGSLGVAVCFDPTNKVSFYEIRNWRNFPWRSYKVIIAAGPTLVSGGRISLAPRSEKFRDPDLFRPASRSALGVTADNKLLLVSVPKAIHLRDMAYIMKRLGARNAVNLDGGSSTALYYRGLYLVRPERVMTNIFTVYEKKEAVGMRY